MELTAVVVHKIEKEANTLSSITTADNLLPTGIIEAEFIGEVSKGYYDRSNPMYGTFDPDEDTYPFQKLLNRYLNGETTFLDFTVKAMRQLKLVMDLASASTGGYVLFAHYVNQAQSFLMTVMINSKSRYNINQTLSIEKLLSIDIDKLDVANIVNISRWADHAPEKNYLSFARGRKDVSIYFRKFIGCLDQTSAVEASKNFRRAVEDYLDNMGSTNEAKDETRKKIFNYCAEKIREKKEIALSFVSNLIDEENPDDFRIFAASEAYQVNASITGHKATLRELTRFVYKGKTLRLEFDNSLRVNNIITYSPEENAIIIREVPEDLKAKFEEESL